MRSCAARDYEKASQFFTPSFAKNLPVPELRTFFEPFWAYGSVASIGPLKRRETEPQKSNTPTTAASAAPSAAPHCFTSLITLQPDVYSRFEAEFVLFFWVDKLNGMMVPRGIVQGTHSAQEKEAQMEGEFCRFVVW